MTTDSEFLDNYQGRVTKARKDASLTQAQVATHLGIDRDKYKQYEKRSALPQEMIKPFCELTGVTVEWLVTGEEKQNALSPQQRRWLSIMENASARKRKQLENLARDIKD